MGWVIAAGVLVLLVVFLVVVWRAEPRGPGERIRQRSLFGGPIGPGAYRGVDAKKSRGPAPEEEAENDRQQP